MADANKSLMTGVLYSCLLRAFVSAWQIQKYMLTIIPNEGSRESTQGAEGTWNRARELKITENEKYTL